MDETSVTNSHYATENIGWPQDADAVTSELIVADIGGTHARFALAQIVAGKVVALENIVKMVTSEHANLQMAWEAYGAELGRPLPQKGAIAVAAALEEEVIYFTNSSWMLRPAKIAEKLNLAEYTLINDFGAVAHAVANLGRDQFAHICGPDKPPKDQGNISIVGPGTGLGVAQLLLHKDDYHVIETEGGHTDFAPLDSTEDRLLEKLRSAHRRVSNERVASGPALQEIYKLVAELEGLEAQDLSDKELWALALSGQDALAAAAFDRFCLCIGAVAGDLALAHGAHHVVIAGGLGTRIGERWSSSGFRERFSAKGRFQAKLENVSVHRLLYPEPGLYGAAAAFLKEHGE